MNKNITIGAFIIITVLGYYGISNKKSDVFLKGNNQPTVKVESENYFAQNQSCLKYKDEIANKLEAKDSPFGRLSLEQIFYSPKINSCLYVEFSEKNDFYNKRLLDIRNDGYGSEPLTMCNAVFPSPKIKEAWVKNGGDDFTYQRLSVGCDNFDKELLGYK